MIPRKFRLPLGSFSRRAATLATTPLFSVKSEPNQLPYNRYGVIIRVQTIKTAARRHLFKRRLLSIVRGWPPARHASQLAGDAGRPYGHDFLFIAREGAARASFASLREACENAKVKLINNL